jgi:hypothetical protein
MAAVAAAAPVVDPVQEERRQALLDSFARFGYNDATCAAIVDGLNLQGPATLATFSDVRLVNLADQLLKYHAPRGRGAVPANAVRMPLTVLDDLKAYKKWVMYRQWQGLSTDPEDFDDDALEFARERLAELQIFSEAEDQVEVEKPEKLKSSEKFHEFYERLEHYLSRVRGSCDVPLIWLCRKHTEVTPEKLEDEYESKDAYFMATMLLEGPRYKEDNKKLFDILLEATAGTTAEAYVKPFEKKRDGRKAFVSLKLQCGGPASIEARSARAHKVIETLKYDGPKKNYTIADYSAKFTQAYQDLKDCGEIIPQRRQVFLYLRGIRHPELKHGVSYCRGILKNDFKGATQHMAEEEMALRDGMQPRQPDREISEADRDGERKRGRKRRGKRGPESYVPDPDRPHIHDGSYTDEEWKSLTADEREEVKELHKKRKANEAKDDEEQAD